MNFDQLITFVSVANTKNYTFTAESMGLTQPSVTARIKNLEDELGTALFYRTGKSMELTRAGERLLDYSNRILDLLREARMEVGRVPDELTIGATPTLGIYTVPRIVDALHNYNNNINFVMKQNYSHQLLNMVISGSIDMALIFQPMEHPDIVVRPLQEKLSIILTAPANHGLAAQKVTSSSELCNYKLIRTNTKGGLWQRVEDLMEKHNIRMNSFARVDSFEVAKHMLYETEGMAFLPYKAVEKEISNGYLSHIQIRDVPPFEFPVFLVMHKHFVHSPLIKLVQTL